MLVRLLLKKDPELFLVEFKGTRFKFYEDWRYKLCEYFINKDDCLDRPVGLFADVVYLEACLELPSYRKGITENDYRS